MWTIINDYFQIAKISIRFNSRLKVVTYNRATDLDNNMVLLFAFLFIIMGGGEFPLS